KVLDRAVEAAPDTFTTRELRARVDFLRDGNLQPMQQLLASWPENEDPNGTITLARYNYRLYQNDYPELIKIFERSPAQKSRGETSAPISKACSSRRLCPNEGRIESEGEFRSGAALGGGRRARESG
ncbi:MAG TPA: hypothetical protein VGL24_09895, partial [Chthoniobacterales bacterium]